MEINTEKNSVLLKNILLLVVAIIIGGAAYYLSNQHLAKKEAELAEKFQGDATKMAAVVVASSDIMAGSIVNSANLAITQIAAEHAPLDVITPDDFEKIKDHTALINIPKGKPILPSYIASVITERFSDLLLPGQRALTFPVDQLNSSDGMLKPGDKVDLFLLSEVKATDTVQSEKELISLLQDVTILATGNIPNVPLPGQENATVDMQYTTLTIAVAPQDAQKVLLAKDSGSIVTLLRNREDKNQLPQSILHYGALKGQRGQVEYFSGSTAEAGVLKAQMQPIRSMTPEPELPLQYWNAEK